jgi:hypothetical protein
LKIKKIDLCGLVFKEFIKQIDENSIYLIKREDRWFVSSFSRRSDDEKERLNPIYWSLDRGAYSMQVSHRGNTFMDPEFQEIYEIIDPDLMGKKAKKKLLEPVKEDEGIDGFEKRLIDMINRH